MIATMRWFLLAVLLIAPQSGAIGHALEPGYLDMRQLTPQAWQVFWRKPDVNGAPMSIEAELPATCTPRLGKAPNSDGYAWITAWVATCEGGIQGQEISIPGLKAQNTDVLVRLHPMGSPAATFRLTPSGPNMTVPAKPSSRAVFVSYLGLGFEHILEGWDHLLFVFALLVLIRDPWRLFGAITAFTVAHSVTLALAALGHITVPGPPVEACIALSIVFLSVEILKQDAGSVRLSERFPWVVSFSFGLLHGVGFAGALKEIGLPHGDIPMALLAFNVGVELGQLAFVSVILATYVLITAVIPAFARAFRAGTAPGTVVTGYAIGGIATFWLVERVSGF